MGELYVVGIGPGNYENLTIRADEALRACDVIVGYTVYVELIRERYPGKEFRVTGMMREAERCRMALAEAESGRRVALVCSGDSGVYGMASLCFELRGERAEPLITVIPGITAALGGGALLGAPLAHDFAVISLSDYLTPWETIERRLLAAAEADFAIAIYNPASRARRDSLRRACDILMRVLPGGRPCGLCRNIGREGERVTVLSLAELREAEADMFCTVFVGNSGTRVIGGRLVTPRGYRKDE